MLSSAIGPCHQFVECGVAMVWVIWGFPWDSFSPQQLNITYPSYWKHVGYERCIIQTLCPLLLPVTFWYTSYMYIILTYDIYNFTSLDLFHFHMTPQMILSFNCSCLYCLHIPPLPSFSMLVLTLQLFLLVHR